VFGAGTVTFTTSHFSTFQAASKGARAPVTGSYRAIEIMGLPRDYSGGEVGYGIGAVTLNTNMFGYYVERNAIWWDKASDSPAPGISAGVLQSSVSVGGVQRLDDTRFDLTDDFQQPFGTLRRGVSDDVLLLEHAPGLRLGVTMLLRDTDVRPTLNMISGKWNVAVVEFKSGALDAGSNTVPLYGVADAGTAVISGDGKIAFKFAGGVKRYSDFPSGKWSRESSGAGSRVADIAITQDDFPEISFDPLNLVALSICAGGDVMFGPLLNVDRGFGGATNQTGFMILVREASGASSAAFAGSFLDMFGGMDLTASNPPAGDIIGVTWRAQSGETVLATTGGVTTGHSLCISATDPATGERFYDVSNVPAGSAGKYTLAPSGVLAIPSLSASGAMSPDGGFYFYVRRDAKTLGIGFGIREP
jgi:hypothetical protein